MTTYLIVDTRSGAALLNDAARPYALLEGPRVLNRYETREQAKRAMHNRKRLIEAAGRAAIADLDNNRI